MANRATKAARNLARKNNSDTFFHGTACLTDFRDKNKNPANKRKSPWVGGKKKANNRDSAPPASLL